MIEIKEKKDCCGCCSCAGICPNKCIEMKTDDEGFVYPNIDKDKCTNCHLCEKVCPMFNNQEKEKYECQQKGYIVQHKDPSVLREATSGGAFTAIAKYVLDRNGIVFGVELQKDLFASPSPARHVWVDKEEDLRKFRNSKYIQSYVGEQTAQKIKSFLDEGRYVCFSGTPCQVAGIKQFLNLTKTNQSKLILVDVVCRAVPSPMIFKKYIEFQEKKNSEKILNVRFRDKYYGYKFSTMNIISDKNQGKYHKGVESDPWLRAFFSNICDRPSCHNCQFRMLQRESDFTIWDCFQVGRFSHKLDNDKGATRMIVHSAKGMGMIKTMQENLYMESFTIEQLVTGSKEIYESVAPNQNRKAFFSDAANMDGYSLFQKYFPETSRVRIERFVRMMCLKLGIYGIAKKLFVKTTGKY